MAGPSCFFFKCKKTDWARRAEGPAGKLSKKKALSIRGTRDMVVLNSNSRKKTRMDILFHFSSGIRFAALARSRSRRKKNASTEKRTDKKYRDPDRRTDTQTYRQTDYRQTNRLQADKHAHRRPRQTRQTDRQTNRQKDRQTDRQTDRETGRERQSMPSICVSLVLAPRASISSRTEDGGVQLGQAKRVAEQKQGTRGCALAVPPSTLIYPVQHCTPVSDTKHLELDKEKKGVCKKV